MPRLIIGAGGGGEEATGSFFSTKMRKSHEQVTLPKFWNQPQNRLENRNIFLLDNNFITLIEH